MTDTPYATRPQSEHVIDVTQLLRRYPDLEPAETRRLLEVFRTLSILEVALLTTDEWIRPRLDAFRRDHKRELRPPLGHYFMFLAIPVTLLIALTWGLWRTAVGG